MRFRLGTFSLQRYPFWYISGIQDFSHSSFYRNDVKMMKNDVKMMKNVKKKKKGKAQYGHVIKCLSTELGRAGRKICGSQSWRTDLVALSPRTP